YSRPGTSSPSPMTSTIFTIHKLNATTSQPFQKIFLFTMSIFETTPQCEMYFAVTNLRRLCIWPLVPVFAHRFSTPSFITTQMSAAPCIFSTPLAQPGLSDLFSRRAHPFTAFRKRFRSRKTNISLRHLAPTPRPKLRSEEHTSELQSLA